MALYIIEIDKNQIGEVKQNLKYIMSHKIQIEEIKNKDRVPHCNNCQQWGHTKAGCFKVTVCPLCAKTHDISVCPKTDPLKCANCAQAHVATWAGCPALTEIKRERKAALERTHSLRTNNTTTTFCNNQFPPIVNSNQYNRSIKNISYANIAAGQPPNPNNSQGTNIWNSITSFISSINISKIYKLLHDLITIITRPDDLMTKITTGLTLLMNTFTN